MSEEKLSPFKLTPARIIILGMVLLAIVVITGAVTGGLSGYEQLREASMNQQLKSAP